MQVFKQLRSSESTRNTFKNVRHPARRFTRQQLHLYTIEIRITIPFIQLISAISNTLPKCATHPNFGSTHTFGNYFRFPDQRSSCWLLFTTFTASALHCGSFTALRSKGTWYRRLLPIQLYRNTVIEEQMLKAETTKLRTKHLCELGPIFQRRDQ